jgi:hypothetical protein
MKKISPLNWIKDLIEENEENIEVMFKDETETVLEVSDFEWNIRFDLRLEDVEDLKGEEVY